MRGQVSAPSSLPRPGAGYRPISGYRPGSGYRPISGYRWASGCCPVSGYRPISGYPPITRIRQNPDATGAWRTDIRIRIRHGYPDFRIRLRALVTILKVSPCLATVTPPPPGVTPRLVTPVSSTITPTLLRSSTERAPPAPSPVRALGVRVVWSIKQLFTATAESGHPRMSLR